MVQFKRRHLIQIPLVGVVYFATAYFGLNVDAVSGFAALIWPPTGIAIATMLLFGYPICLGIFAGALAVNLLMGATFFGAISIGAGNTLEALAAVYFLNRYANFNLRLKRLKDAGTFLFVSLAAPLISATIGVLTIVVTKDGQLEGIWTTWRAWWAGDVLGAMVVTPVLLILATQKWRALNLKRSLEFTFLLALIFVVGLSLFNGLSRYTFIPTNFPYLLFPLVVWAALRFGQLGNTSLALIISCLAAAGTIQGYGPFVQADVRESLLLLHGFMAVMTSTCIVLAAAISERNDAIYARDEFLSIASHELKTPITSLSLQNQIMLKSIKNNPHVITPPEQLGKLFSSSHKQIHRLSALVDDLMDISRMRSGRLQLRFDNANVSEIVKETASRVAAQAHEAGCAIELSIQNDVSAYCDALRVEQILNNLISNAFKYARGQPLKISLVSQSNSMRIAVEDGGPGIPAESHSKIFERFERANTVSQTISGLGLGLYIVQEIVKAHHGQIYIEKSSYGGAKFVVDLPRPKTAEATV